MMNPEINNGKAALIVGGANGLGAAIAKRLSEQCKNKKIIIADRCSNNELINAEFIEIDLSYERLDRLYGLDIDTLIITAGIGRLSSFDTFTDKEIEKNFNVNTLPALKLISAYYDKINSKQNFFTCIISSIAGIVASPLYAIYSASKASLVKFTEAANAELEYSGSENRILNVAPGHFFGTAFHGNPVEASLELTDLATDILEKMGNKDSLFIPKEAEIYGRVVKEYQTDGRLFAQNSIGYKLKNNKINDVPQIKVGYLTGTFDLFHIGHLNLLRRAKRYCDKLIVGIHPDGKHKNKEVFIPLDERIEIVKSIEYVDDVIVCTSEDIDAYPLIKYDYLFVGSDYQGTERFKRYEEYFADKPAQIIYLPYTAKTSSTKLRNLIDTKSAEKKN